MNKIKTWVKENRVALAVGTTVGGVAGMAYAAKVSNRNTYDWYYAIVQAVAEEGVAYLRDMENPAIEYEVKLKQDV